MSDRLWWRIGASCGILYVVLQSGALSRWLGWGAAVIAVASLAAVAAPISGPAQLPAFLFLLWIVAASVVLMRREEEQAPVLTGALSPSS